MSEMRAYNALVQKLTLKPLSQPQRGTLWLEGEG